MPRQKIKEELEERIDELEAENEALQDQVDAIQDILIARKISLRFSLKRKNRRIGELAK
jgi:chaperonin cofactor prefoldin